MSSQLNKVKNKISCGFSRFFSKKPHFFFSVGGRLELIGNHTDHNHGLCLVGNCSLRISAAVSKNRLNKVRIKSIGFPFFEFSLDDLKHSEGERTSMDICKGILYKLSNDGYKIGGFDAYISSDIPNGSGVSSSAAIESLYGFIISYLFNDGKISNLEIAKTGQYSENVFFNKPCGLLDQIGTSFGNCNFIDFADVENPYLENIPFALPIDIYLVKSEGNHTALTPLYKKIPDSMHKAANALAKKEFLRDCDDDEIFLKIQKLDNCDSEEKAIASHFFIENSNVLQAKEALETNNTESFLDAIRKSQYSSKNNLKNTYVEGEYAGSPQSIIDKLEPVLGQNGAMRIHGGGFKGTVICYVKKSFSEEFNKILREKFHEKDIFKVEISTSEIIFEQK